MSRRIDGNAGKEVEDEQRGPANATGARESVERGEVEWNGHGTARNSRSPRREHLTFKWAARSNGDARTREPPDFRECIIPA